jgi:hypothetical protein
MKFKTLAVALVALSCSGAAKAEVSTFEFQTVVGNFYEASGLVYTQDAFNALGAASVVAVTGSVVGSGGAAIDGLVANPNQPLPQMYFGGSYDNNAFPNTPVVDQYGVLFKAGAYYYRIYSEGGSYWLTSNNPGVLNLGTTDTSGEPAILGTLFVSAGLPGTLPPTVTLGVPEPATWAMMLAGFTGLVMFGRSRRFNRPALA